MHVCGFSVSGTAVSRPVDVAVDVRIWDGRRKQDTVMHVNDHPPAQRADYSGCQAKGVLVDIHSVWGSVRFWLNRNILVASPWFVKWPSRYSWF